MIKILQREGTGVKVLEILYKEVIHVVLLFGLESWILSEEMEKTVKGEHTGFLRQIMGKCARWDLDMTWVTPAEEELW